MAEGAISEIGLESKEGIGNTFSEIRKDKILLFLFIIIILLGITVRFIYPTEPGLWNDDMSALPTAVLWFYPHDSYPGLSAMGEPALSNFIIGTSCMLSGQDFSNVTKITPVWFPDRAILLGEAISKSEDYCRIPMYLFGILFFAAIIILSFLLLDKYASLYVIAFFAFNPFILQFSRYIKADIILDTFLVSGLIFLWKAYSAEKESKTEFICFLISMGFFALALATKLPPVVYAILAVAVIAGKYKAVIISWLKETGNWLGIKAAEKINTAGVKSKRLLILLFSGLLIFIMVLLPPYEFNLKNIWLVAQMYRRTAGSLGYLSLNFNILHIFKEFVFSINIIDLLLLLFSVYIFVVLLFKKKDSKEKYILFLVLFLLFMAFIFPMTSTLRIFMSFAFGLIFLMALGLSSKRYSLFGVLKINNSKYMRKLYLVILIIYISIFSFTAFAIAPYFQQNWMPLCSFTDCENLLYGAVGTYMGLSETQVGEYLRDLLKDNNNETFDLFGQSQMAYYYTRQEEGQEWLYFRESFKAQIGRLPTVRERVQYFKPSNRTVRYVVVDPGLDYSGKVPGNTEEFLNELQKDYVPNHKVILKKGIEAAWIYDLKNLTKISDFTSS